MRIYMGEEAVDVREHPEFDYYAASKDGRIFTKPCLHLQGLPKSGPRPRANYWREVSTFIVQPKHTPPYRKCRITQGGKTRLVLVHRFILECWEGLQPQGVVTRHLNGDPLDNRLCNLKYGTIRENVQDTFKHSGNYAEGEKNGRASLTENDVRNIRKRFDLGERVAEIQRDYPYVTKTTIDYAAKRKTWSHVR